MVSSRNSFLLLRRLDPEGLGREYLLDFPKSPEEEFILYTLMSLLSDMSESHHRSRSLRRDMEELCSRLRDEGFAFLTKALPRLGKALDQGLETRYFACPLGFKKHSGKKIPLFLGSIFSNVFDDAGNLLDDACLRSIQFIRQFCFLVYKYEIPCSSSQEDSVLTEFLRNEQELSTLVIDECDPVIKLSARILDELFEGFDPREIVPGHGPGSVATGEKNDRKWTFSRFYVDLDRRYPYDEYFIVGQGREILDRHEWYLGLRSESHSQAKVVFVPKDSRGPRLISMEPLEKMWIQQGLWRKLCGHLENHRFTKGHINFRNQEINRQLAMDSSISRLMATLDLKDASDRVADDLVRHIFPKEIYLSLQACRSSHTLLPNGISVELRKYAPMGSALCFPVEALTFWVLSVASVALVHQIPWRRAMRAVYVYGDDLIVSRSTAQTVITALERFGLVVNRSKCFMRGFFRESCGMDAYRGVDVTPVRFKTRMTFNKRDGSAYMAYTASYNLLAKAGWKKAANHVLNTVERIYRTKVPYSLAGGTDYSDDPTGSKPRGFPGVRRYTPDGIEVTSHSHMLSLNRELHVAIGRNQHVQRASVRTWCLVPKATASELDGWGRLLRNLTSGTGPDPSSFMARGAISFVKRNVLL